MKFATIMSMTVLASQAIKIQRQVALDDTNQDVEAEFNTLNQKPSADSFSVAVQTFGTHPNNSCKNGDTATVNYTGKLKDGRVFDSSIKDGIAQPFKFTVG